MKKPPGDQKDLPEVSLQHLLATPPSHFTPQKVRGLVEGFTGLRDGKQPAKKYSYVIR
jgi:hypothetical protein